MSQTLEGRVVIVTGAGRGLGGAHALYLASQGASVLVNDLGGDVHGEGADLTAAQRVAAEIERRGGRAAVSGHDVSSWEQARQMVTQAVDTFGQLDVLVNNAGILSDRTLANMSEAEWDAVLRVHLKGHAAPTSHALAYWRDRAKGGHEVKASVIHTTSVAAFAGSLGQANYSAAKAAVLALSRVVSLEAGRYGVRSNAVSPSARTRITTGIEDDGPAPRGSTRWTRRTSRPSSAGWPSGIARPTPRSSTSPAGGSSCSRCPPLFTRSRPRDAGPGTP